jgi:hypothetical protein
MCHPLRVPHLCRSNAASHLHSETLLPTCQSVSQVSLRLLRKRGEFGKAIVGEFMKPITLETSSLMKFLRYVFQGQGTYDFQESRTCEDSESRTCDFRESRTCEDSESRTCDFRESRTCEDSESRTGGFRESRTYKASGDADMQSSGISNR